MRKPPQPSARELAWLAFRAAIEPELVPKRRPEWQDIPLSQFARLGSERKKRLGPLNRKKGAKYA